MFLNNAIQLVVCSLNDGRYALRLAAVERIVRAVEVTAVPNAPEVVLGVINVKGRIVPVFNIRRRFKIKERDVELTDHFIIATAGKRVVALVVDAVLDLIERSDKEIVTPETILSDMEYVEGVAKYEDGIVFIHDLGGFLSLGEETQLDQALKVTQGRADDV